MADQKKPRKQYPFPRAVTAPITGPAYDENDTWDEARQKWFAYIRVVSRIRQMDLAPLHKERDR